MQVNDRESNFHRKFHRTLLCTRPQPQHLGAPGRMDGVFTLSSVSPDTTLAKISKDDRTRAEVRMDLDRTLRAAGIDPAIVIQETPATPTEHDRYARERLLYRDQDPLVRLPGD